MKFRLKQVLCLLVFFSFFLGTFLVAAPVKVAEKKELVRAINKVEKYINTFVPNTLEEEVHPDIKMFASDPAFLYVLRVYLQQNKINEANKVGIEGLLTEYDNSEQFNDLFLLAKQLKVYTAKNGINIETLLSSETLALLRDAEENPFSLACLNQKQQEVFIAEIRKVLNIQEEIQEEAAQ